MRRVRRAQIGVVRVRLVRTGVISAVPVIHTPRDAASALAGLVGDLDREGLAVLLLDATHRVLAAHVAALGQVDAAPVHPREVFKAAILAGASAVIVGHNHPSGDLAPSPRDLAVTRRLVRAGALLGIPVLDALVVAGGRYACIPLRAPRARRDQMEREGDMPAHLHGRGAGDGAGRRAPADSVCGHGGR